LEAIYLQIFFVSFLNEIIYAKADVLLIIYGISAYIFM